MTKERSKLLMTLSRTLYAAGVANARSLLEHVLRTWIRPPPVLAEPDETSTKAKSKEKFSKRVPYWARELEAKPKLLFAIVKGTNWLSADEVKEVACNRKLDSHARTVAENIEAVHQGLNNDVHTFVPDVGLVIHEGVPNSNATHLLECICVEYGIPYEVLKAHKNGVPKDNVPEVADEDTAQTGT